MRIVRSMAIAGLLAPAALIAQTAPPASLPPIPSTQPLGDPDPLDGAKGIDTDILCLTAVAGPATAESKAGKPDAMLDGATNYFLGRIAARQDRGTFLANLKPLGETRFDKPTMLLFASNCLRRYMTAQMDVMVAVGEIMTSKPAK